MAIFNSSVPANTESAKLGAQRIREVKASLNTALGQVFDDDLVFRPGFVTTTLLQSDASVDGNRAVNSDHIRNNAIILRTIPDGLFTADSPGRAKFADGFVSSALLDPAIVFPTGSVTEAALAALSVSTAKIQDGAVTLAKLTATGIAKIASSVYAGSDSVSATVSGLAFAPDFVVLTGGLDSDRVGIAFRSEASGGIGPIHKVYESDNIDNESDTAIHWTSDGFIIAPVNYTFNDGGKTHGYLALGV